MSAAYQIRQCGCGSADAGESASWAMVKAMFAAIGVHANLRSSCFSGVGYIGSSMLLGLLKCCISSLLSAALIVGYHCWVEDAHCRSVLVRNV